MLQESKPHKRYHLKINMFFKAPNPSIQHAKQASRWFQPLVNLCSRDPRYQDTVNLPIYTTLPQVVNKIQLLFSIVTCWSDLARWVSNHDRRQKEPSLYTICPYKTLIQESGFHSYFVKMKSHFSGQYVKFLHCQHSSTSWALMFFHFIPHIYHYPLRPISKLCALHILKISPAMALSQSKGIFLLIYTSVSTLLSALSHSPMWPFSTTFLFQNLSSSYMHFTSLRDIPYLSTHPCWLWRKTSFCQLYLSSWEGGSLRLDSEQGWRQSA